MNEFTWIPGHRTTLFRVQLLDRTEYVVNDVDEDAAAVIAWGLIEDEEFALIDAFESEEQVGGYTQSVELESYLRDAENWEIIA